MLRPNILHSSLFSHTLSLHSSLNVSDQISHPYKTRSKNRVLRILIFVILHNTLEDKKDSAPNDSKYSLTSICTFLPNKKVWFVRRNVYFKLINAIKSLRNNTEITEQMNYSTV